MESVSRRKFFKQAGAVATVAGTMAVAPLGLASTVAGAASTREEALAPKEQLRGNEDLVAHVKNARTGEIALFIGHREITIRDRKLAAQLVRATR